MSILIFWDRDAPEGLQYPVKRIISHILEMPVEISDNPIMLRGYDRARNQNNASKILTDIQDIYTRRYGCGDTILIVTPKDLYIPGRDFVFGLARPNINAALISTARLGNSYYGRSERDDDLIDRIVKEGAHEICHLMGLDHCQNPECIMFCPQTLDELDRKKKMLCQNCQQKLNECRAEII
ncbi:MAG: archaemetzincin family Zn-dependent metalloprotease [Euryarchaeota archaeon]|nr:archaemetzincin family Zn-dependent metalloprotease [Euryarchaeota archaeon]